MPVLMVFLIFWKAVWLKSGQALQIMTAADILGVSYTTIFSKGDLNMPLQEL